MARASTSSAGLMTNLYLPSWAELGISVNDVPYTNEICAEANEKQFSMYTGNNQRIKKTFNNTGTAQNYWTRSAYSGSSASACSINYNGGSNNNPASNWYSVCVGLSISKIN